MINHNQPAHTKSLLTRSAYCSSTSLALTPVSDANLAHSPPPQLPASTKPTASSVLANVVRTSSRTPSTVHDTGPAFFFFYHTKHIESTSDLLARVRQTVKMPKQARARRSSVNGPLALRIGRRVLRNPDQATAQVCAAPARTGGPRSFRGDRHRPHNRRRRIMGERCAHWRQADA